MITDNTKNFLTRLKSIKSSQHQFPRLLQLFELYPEAVSEISQFATHQKDEDTKQLVKLEEATITEQKTEFNRIEEYCSKHQVRLPKEKLHNGDEISTFEAHHMGYLVSSNPLPVTLNQILGQYLELIIKPELTHNDFEKLLFKYCVCNIDTAGLQLKFNDRPNMDLIFNELRNLKNHFCIHNQQFDNDLQDYEAHKINEDTNSCRLSLINAFNSLLYRETYSSRHLDFMKKYIEADSNGKITHFNFSASYSSYLAEHDKVENAKHAKGWYAWEQIKDIIALIHKNININIRGKDLSTYIDITVNFVTAPRRKIDKRINSFNHTEGILTWNGKEISFSQSPLKINCLSDFFYANGKPKNIKVSKADMIKKLYPSGQFNAAPKQLQDRLNQLIKAINKKAGKVFVQTKGSKGLLYLNF